MKILTYLNINIYTRLVLIALLMIAHQGWSQDKLRLSLKQVSERALDQNRLVRKAHQNVAVASAELKYANAVFLPSVNLSETYVTTNDPLGAFGIKLQQQTTSTSDFDPLLLNDPGTIDNFKTRIFVEQPILNLDGIGERRVALNQKKASEQELKWTKRSVLLQARKVYFKLQLAHEQKKAVQSALEAGKANYQVAQDLFALRLIHKADLLSAQVRLTEIESLIIAAENQIGEINAEATHILGYEPTVTISPTDPVIVGAVSEALLSTHKVPPNRPDLEAMSLRVEANKQQLRSARGSLLPMLNAFGSYEWNDTNFFGVGASNYLAGLKLEWNIFNGGRQLARAQSAAYQQKLAEINYEEKRSNSERELHRIQSEVVLAKKQMQLADLAVQQAKEAYTVRKNRFDEGLERTSDVLTAESDLLVKQIRRLERMNQVQQLIFTLEILLGQDLKIQ